MIYQILWMSNIKKKDIVMEKSNNSLIKIPIRERNTQNDIKNNGKHEKQIPKQKYLSKPLDQFHV